MTKREGEGGNEKFADIGMMGVLEAKDNEIEQLRHDLQQAQVRAYKTTLVEGWSNSTLRCRPSREDCSNQQATERVRATDTESKETDILLYCEEQE